MVLAGWTGPSIHGADPHETRVRLSWPNAAVERTQTSTSLGVYASTLCSSRDEAQQLMAQAGRHSRRTTEMEALLEGVRGQVQDLEDRCLAQVVQQRDHAQRLQQDKLTAQVS